MAHEGILLRLLGADGQSEEHVRSFGRLLLHESFSVGAGDSDAVFDGAAPPAVHGDLGMLPKDSGMLGDMVLVSHPVKLPHGRSSMGVTRDNRYSSRKECLFAKCNQECNHKRRSPSKYVTYKGLRFDFVVREGVEPPTHGFSVHCSTN